MKYIIGRRNIIGINPINNHWVIVSRQAAKQDIYMKNCQVKRLCRTKFPLTFSELGVNEEVRQRLVNMVTSTDEEMKLLGINIIRGIKKLEPITKLLKI